MTRLTLATPLLILLLGGMSCAPDPAPLAPIPPPAAVIVKVPTYIAIPADLTTPCAKPRARPIRTDVDLLQAADAMRVWGACNANKLRAIEEAQP